MARPSCPVQLHGILRHLARNKKHRKLIRRLATLLVCKDYIDQLWCMKPSKSSREMLVRPYIAKAWTEHHIKDMATYRAFNDIRGSGHSSGKSATVVSTGYMVYLLFVNPEMLMTGARRSLFRAMYNQLKDIPLYNNDSVLLEEEQVTQNIIHRIMGTDQGSGMVRDPWAIADKLSCLKKDEEGIWRVVQGVWVEMLCFSAGRCRGYLHAKALGKGGEFLSYIWLLMFYIGMKTVAEKMRRSEDGGGSVVDTNSVSQGATTEDIMFDKRRGAFDISILTS